MSKRQAGLVVGLIFNLKRIDPKATGDDAEAEYDSEKTISAIEAGIASHGHRVVRIEATPDFPEKVRHSGIDFAFNLAEGVRGRAREAVVPAVLDLYGIDYTGSDATTLALALDKDLTKRVARAAKVPSAPSIVMKTGKERIPRAITYPAVVKPNAEGSSKGVTKSSVVRSEAELRERATEMAAKYHQGALVESFLPGREFTVGVLGDADRPKVLPPMELVFTDPGNDAPIYLYEHKLDFSPTLRYDAPAQLDAGLKRQLETAAKRVWKALGCRDVARIDFRLDAKGRVNLIEVNPLPGMTPDWSDLCLIAKGAGMTYEQLIGAIIAPAVARARARAKTRGPA